MDRICTSIDQHGTGDKHQARDLEWAPLSNRQCRQVQGHQQERFAASGGPSQFCGWHASWRPFLQELWGALAGDGGYAPPNCIWTSQIKSALAWQDLFFLSGVRGTLVCTPWTLGQMWRSQSSSPSTPRPGAWAASSKCKATLCPSSRVPFSTWILKSSATPSARRLASNRSWKSYWTKDRTKLLIRGDLVSMLTMVLCLKPSRSCGLGLLAREMALDLAEGAYKPDIAAVHIVGVTNKLADLLSREAAPGGTGDRPLVLHQSSETVILPRPRSWYRTLKPLSPVLKRGLSVYKSLWLMVRKIEKGTHVVVIARASLRSCVCFHLFLALTCLASELTQSLHDSPCLFIRWTIECSFPLGGARLVLWIAFGPKVSLVRPLFGWYQACPAGLISCWETVIILSLWCQACSVDHFKLMICLVDLATRWYQSCPADQLLRQYLCLCGSFVVPGLSCWSLELMVCLVDLATRWYQACPAICCNSICILCLLRGVRLFLNLTLSSRFVQLAVQWYQASSWPTSSRQRFGHPCV